MKLPILISLSFAFALPGSAHQGGHDVRGVAAKVSAEELTVQTKKGSERFVLTPKTEFVKDGSPSAAQDLHEADRVVVHGKKKGGQMEAVKVEFAGPKKE